MNKALTVVYATEIDAQREIADIVTGRIHEFLLGERDSRMRSQSASLQQPSTYSRMVQSVMKTTSCLAKDSQSPPFSENRHADAKTECVFAYFGSWVFATKDPPSCQS